MIRGSIPLFKNKTFHLFIDVNVLRPGHTTWVLFEDYYMYDAAGPLRLLWRFLRYRRDDRMIVG